MSDLGFLIWSIVIIASIMTWFVWKSRRKNEKRHEKFGRELKQALHSRKQRDDRLCEQKDCVRLNAERFAQVLAKKRTQLVVIDDYGDTDRDRWLDEVQRFYESKVKPHLIPIWHPEDEQNISGNDIAEIIDDVAETYRRQNDVLFDFDENMDGIEYEHFCADLLRRAGWEARVSQASNDQGVDIVATKQDHSVAIQCKKYSSPVGNKAVQEVVAGAQFYQLNTAVVVSNASFTASALQLASSSGVILAHHSELAGLEEMIRRIL